MTKNESKARRILYAATKTDVDMLCAIYHIVGKDELPKLTDDECKNIAVNYPISLQDIRSAFPRLNNNLDKCSFL